ncbi:unnamed protein product [Prorocentrum cordatum]|uniref:CASP-like protein n=1 Tax=Prorocentrum cordatum TaxID=2364126 RepID=A0ABN9W7P5_9DINO|nr:unnamed protein product [Polarella glacialis]
MCLLHSDAALLSRGGAAQRLPGERAVRLQRRSRAAAAGTAGPRSSAGAAPASDVAVDGLGSPSKVAAPGIARAGAGPGAGNSSTATAALPGAGGAGEKARAAGGAGRARPGRGQGELLAAARSAVMTSISRAALAAPITHHAVLKKRADKDAAGASLLGRGSRPARGRRELRHVLDCALLFVASGALIALAGVASFGFSSRKENWWSKSAAEDIGLASAEA